MAISATAVYAVLPSEIRLRTDPVFVLLFGGYWLGLLARYYYHPHPELLSYILVAPIVVGTTVVIGPQLIEDNRRAFTMALTAVAVAAVAVAVGLAMLFHEPATDEHLYRWVASLERLAQTPYSASASSTPSSTPAPRSVNGAVRTTPTFTSY